MLTIWMFYKYPRSGVAIFLEMNNYLNLLVYKTTDDLLFEIFRFPVLLSKEFKYAIGRILKIEQEK